MGRHRHYPQYADMPSAEYQPFARKLRAVSQDAVESEWRRVYGLCYQRGLPRPTLAQFRAGAFTDIPPLRTTEQLSSIARTNRYRYLSKTPPSPIVMERPKEAPVDRSTDEVYRVWNLVYQRCRRRGLPHPTIDQVRSGQYELPSVLVNHWRTQYPNALSA